MLERVIGDDIELATVFDPALSRVRIDRNQIEQILLNLAINARDAMPSGGTLTMQTSETVLDDQAVRDLGEMQPGRYATIAVTDTGRGMDAGTRSRIFEPFFTTKPSGVGTGLGLSTVFGIVKQHQGHISVTSECGKGTTFHIHLPVAQETAVAAPGYEKAGLKQEGTETILVVEDEGGVRRLVCDSLTALGYTVFEASRPHEAISIFAEHADAIQLLITDVVMPQMNGVALFDRLVDRRPGLKVLYMSGFADRSVIKHDLSRPGLHFIQKPFSVENLAITMRRILDEPPEVVRG